jgi:hypothetical protein
LNARITCTLRPAPSPGRFLERACRRANPRRAAAHDHSQLSTINASCPSPSTGCTRQQNTNSVSSVNWSNVTATIQDDGTTKTLIVNPPTGDRFYRLKN